MKNKNLQVNVKREVYAPYNFSISQISTKSNQVIILVDLLNLVRRNISNRPGARFNSIEEFISNIANTAVKIKRLGNFDRIYLVTKSFVFNKDVSYHDVLDIIMWAFCSVVPEWSDRITLILANGVSSNDKGADDRTLFIIYDEFIKTIGGLILIFSDDNFGDIDQHFFRHVVLNFYHLKNQSLDPYDWKKTKIQSFHSATFQQNENYTSNSYIVVRPHNEAINYIIINR